MGGKGNTNSRTKTQFSLLIACTHILEKLPVLNSSPCNMCKCVNSRSNTFKKQLFKKFSDLFPAVTVSETQLIGTGPVWLAAEYIRGSGAFWHQLCVQFSGICATSSPPLPHTWKAVCIGEETPSYFVIVSFIQHFYIPLQSG